MDFTGSLYRQRAVSVKFNFLCGAVRYVASKNRGGFYSTAARENPQRNLDTQGQ